MSQEKSYYDILGLDKNASSKDIRKSWKKLQKEFHPDRLPKEKKEWGANKIKEINEAYTVLSDPKLKEKYDKYGKEGMKNGGFPDMDNFHDIFRNFGRNFGNGQNRQVVIRPITVQIKVTLEDIYNGKDIEIDYERRNLCKKCDGTGNSDKKLHNCTKCNGKGITVEVIQLGPGMIQQMQRPCNECNGSGKGSDNKLKCKDCDGKRGFMVKHKIKFTLPKGIHNKDKIKIENQGNEIYQENKKYTNNQRGNVEIIVNELKHETYNRGVVLNQRVDPSNLSLNIDVDFADSIVGFKRQIQHLDGRNIIVNEDDIIKDGDIKVLIGEGLPVKNSDYKKGDLFIKYNVKFPNDISYEQRMEIYKILKGKDFKEDVYPEEYKNAYTRTLDQYNSRQNAYNSDSDERENGNVECVTQ